MSETVKWEEAINWVMKHTGRTRRQAIRALLEKAEKEGSGAFTGINPATGRREPVPRSEWTRRKHAFERTVEVEAQAADVLLSALNKGRVRSRVRARDNPEQSWLIPIEFWRTIESVQILDPSLDQVPVQAAAKLWRLLKQTDPCPVLVFECCGEDIQTEFPR
jgi:hypothetical protein